MSKFFQRSTELEMMDGETNPTILEQNYAEIERVNRYLGGHSTLLKGLSQLTDEQRTYCILDVGCGSGDAISAMLYWAVKNDIAVHLIGLDYSSTACNIASERFLDRKNVEIVCSDYQKYEPSKSIDIICSNLFNHHLSDEQNKNYLKWAYGMAKCGLVINDLHRHPLAYYSIKWIARLANTSIYFRNDAPLSVLRAFKKKDIRQFAQDTKLNLRLQWCWAFRWLIWVKK